MTEDFEKINFLTENVSKDINLRLKVDWFAFTVDETKDFKNGKDFRILDFLGYSLSDFDEVSGKNFYNSGYTLKNFIKIFYNDPSKKITKGSSFTHNYIFTGVGCSNLQGHIKNDWVKLFRDLRDLFNVKFKRIDICLDDWNSPSLISFDYIRRKVEAGHFKSSKRQYHFINDRSTTGDSLGASWYLGSRKTTGKLGHSMLRVYKKAQQMIYAKKQLYALPQEVQLQSLDPNFKEYKWLRWEIEFTKEKAISMIGLIVKFENDGVKNPITKAFFQVLRGMIDFLVPTKDPKTGKIYKSKHQWKSSEKWLSFLNHEDSVELENPAQIYDLESVHDWILYYVMPTIQMLQKIYESCDLDFYDLMKQLPECDFSKKQESLLLETQGITKDELLVFASHFLNDRGGSH